MKFWVTWTLQTLGAGWRGQTCCKAALCTCCASPCCVTLGVSVPYVCPPKSKWRSETDPLLLYLFQNATLNYLLTLFDSFSRRSFPWKTFISAVLAWWWTERYRRKERRKKKKGFLLDYELVLSFLTRLLKSSHTEVPVLHFFPALSVLTPPKLPAGHVLTHLVIAGEGKKRACYLLIPYIFSVGFWFLFNGVLSLHLLYFIYFFLSFSQISELLLLAMDILGNSAIVWPTTHLLRPHGHPRCAQPSLPLLSGSASYCSFHLELLPSTFFWLTLRLCISTKWLLPKSQ